MKNVDDYIYVTNVIPKKLCKKTIKILQNNKWYKHAWYDTTSKIYDSEKNKELDVSNYNVEIQAETAKFLSQAYQEYFEKHKGKTDKTQLDICTKFSPFRLNKYTKGTMMREHYDHIHSLFDGEHKGIPVLSFIGILNDDYIGGDLKIRDKKIKTKTGDIIIFPSCFMYPHEVTEVKKGTRYSFVSWGF